MSVFKVCRHATLNFAHISPATNLSAAWSWSRARMSCGKSRKPQPSRCDFGRSKPPKVQRDLVVLLMFGATTKLWGRLRMCKLEFKRRHFFYLKPVRPWPGCACLGMPIFTWQRLYHCRRPYCMGNLSVLQNTEVSLIQELICSGSCRQAFGTMNTHPYNRRVYNSKGSGIGRFHCSIRLFNRIVVDNCNMISPSWPPLSPSIIFISSL